MSDFTDEAQLNVKGGDGGAGAVSMRREAHVPKGGPDGGDGGKGGDIWLVADRNVVSLLAFRDHPHRRAESGTHGQGKRRHGSSGPDLLVSVPEGTTIKSQDGELLADLVTAGDLWLAAEGGRGGRGNARFLSNKRRAPAFAEQGEVGQERWLNLELRLMADVALVGFPNVGKSTLISRISRAKPKIADYPFTTLEPNLGVVSSDDGDEIIVADIPGLIEGASEGKGLGYKFLRHIERARALVILIDLAPTAEHDPETQIQILLKELGDYRPELLDRPRIVAGSRADMAESETLVAFPGPKFSSITGQGLPELKGAMFEAVREARQTEPEVETFVVHKPKSTGFSVHREDSGAFVVTGRAALRAVAITDLTNPDALAYVQGRLKSLGVDRALVRAGVKEGDLVKIGNFAFDYLPD